MYIVAVLLPFPALLYAFCVLLGDLDYGICVLLLDSDYEVIYSI